MAVGGRHGPSVQALRHVVYGLVELRGLLLLLLLLMLLLVVQGVVLLCLGARGQHLLRVLHVGLLPQLVELALGDERRQFQRVTDAAEELEVLPAADRQRKRVLIRLQVAFSTLHGWTQSLLARALERLQFATSLGLSGQLLCPPVACDPAAYQQLYKGALYQVLLNKDHYR